MIGLLHGGALGDFVLAWHVLEAVKRAQQDGESVIFARGAVAGVNPLIWHAREVHDTDSAGVHLLFADAAGAVADGPLRQVLARCNVVVNLLTSADHSAAEKLAACVPGAVCSIESGASGEPLHITEQWRLRLAAEGLAIGEITPATLQIDEARRRAARAQLAAAAGTPDEPIVVLHPGSGGRSKCWPLDRFLRLAEALPTRGLQPVFLWGPVEEETWTAQDADRIRRSACVMPLDLTEAIHLSVAADGYVGNDSGMTHAAAATGVRTVAVFGATDPRVWRPLGAHVTVLGRLGDWPAWGEVVAAAARGVSCQVSQSGENAERCNPS